jgi:hypothetical protein
MKIVIGDNAKKALTALLEHGNTGKHHDDYGEPYVAGYFPDTYHASDEECFIAFDNTAGSCFVECFETEAKAIAWCEGKIEAEGL